MRLRHHPPHTTLLYYILVKRTLSKTRSWYIETTYIYTPTESKHMWAKKREKCVHSVYFVHFWCHYLQSVWLWCLRYYCWVSRVLCCKTSIARTHDTYTHIYIYMLIWPATKTISAPNRIAPVGDLCGMRILWPRADTLDESRVCASYS